MFLPLLVFCGLVSGSAVDFSQGIEAAAKLANVGGTADQISPSSEDANWHAIEQDLEASKAKDAEEVQTLDEKITSLVHQRDAARRDEVRKDKEIIFLRTALEHPTDPSKVLAPTSIATVAQTERAAVAARSNPQVAKPQPVEVDEAEKIAAAADAEIHKPAQPSEAAGEMQPEISSSTSSTAIQPASSVIGTEASDAATAANVAEASASPSAAIDGSTDASTGSPATSATAEASGSNPLLRGSVPSAPALSTSAGSPDSSVSATTSALATASAVADGGRAAQSVQSGDELTQHAGQSAKHKAEQETREAAEKTQQEAQLAAQRARQQAETKAEQEEEMKQEQMRKERMDADADSADDSFKQFMKEEDGEDEQGDSAYEDSANALAGAIGWNRKEVESNADSAVKQLTQAIGGKQVVRSVQGMLGGIR